MNAKSRQSFEADGVLVIDKPADWTSHDVVAKVRKILRTRRVGHTGTLDPFATGVLTVCVNRATRLVQFLTGDDKEYAATMRLGFATDTGDFTGEPLAPTVDAAHITTEQIQGVLAQFRGRIQQIPPMYSAKKIGGVRLHELARRGETIERQPIEIEIKEIELQADGSRSTDFSFRVVCSSGTYIRTLAEDIGKQLGVGAHLTALRRTRAGDCRLAQAVTLEQLAELAEAGRVGEVLIPMAEAVNLPEIQLNAEECRAIAHGRSIRRREDWQTETPAKLCNDLGQLLAIAEYDARRATWQPRVVMTTT
ncbi:MAG TPA: tRNA pseudouridine(55) synthase TruB [Blastocatellia bacterium]|nr:tRNA pseudouridine(55) synthase TruB [Blastocatellia bacterium]HMX27011.1 tRNA pseudouridine(55) synthase TruB [Blastocatellia bacterium]HMY70860.1 tRNA pseudouridine(55) synthase TruB [Blastocatellia bacterium]HNG30780.1 tRNA pseudouridine(55) synthase TruB [Blastocatellia bacterium]